MKKNYLADRVNNGALRPMDMRSAKGKLTYGLLTVIMLIHLAIVVVPVLWMIVMSFKEPAEIYSKTPTFFPESFDITKVSRLWNQLEMYKYYVNTIIFALGNVVMDVTFAGLAGFSLSRLKPKGHRTYFAMVSVLMLVPATCAMVPNYMFFMKLGLLNTYFPLWIKAGANLFHILLFKTAFDGVSQSLIEAAKIDGASVMKIFTNIMIPLSIPVIATCSIFTFNGSFGSFFGPYLYIQDPELKTIAVRLFELKNSNLSMDEQMMASLFSILPQVVIFILFQKYIMGGINVGGVKE